MTDDNKLLLFKAIGMRIMPTCLSCARAKFKINADWGLCSKHSYKHKKHRTPRPCPAHACFCCDDWLSLQPLAVVLNIGIYAEILPLGSHLEVAGVKNNEY